MYTTAEKTKRKENSVIIIERITNENNDRTKWKKNHIQLNTQQKQNTFAKQQQKTATKIAMMLENLLKRKQNNNDNIINLFNISLPFLPFLFLFLYVVIFLYLFGSISWMFFFLFSLVVLSCLFFPRTNKYIFIHNLTQC